MAGAGDEIRLTLLGGFELVLKDTPVRLPGPAARVAAITALKGRLHRETIAATLWPDTPTATAQTYLRSALWRLRAVTPELVTAGQGMVTLDRGVRTDAVALLDWVLKVTGGEGAVPSITEPEGVGRELLPGWDDPWLDDHREQLRVLVPEALEAAALARLQEDSLSQAMRYALCASQLDPLRESAVRLLVSIHQQRGNHRAAMVTFSRYRSLLLAELGVEPTPALARLIARPPDP